MFTYRNIAGISQKYASFDIQLSLIRGKPFFLASFLFFFIDKPVYASGLRVDYNPVTILHESDRDLPDVPPERHVRL
jgi:hypothetical protein